VRLALRMDAWRYRTTLAFYRLWRAAGGPDYAEEIEFWDGILGAESALLFDPKVRAMAVPAELRRCAVELATEFHRLPRLLEVGSGPVSLLAGAVDDGLCTVVAVDPLARVYRQLLDRHGMRYPIRPRVGHGERLAFPQGSFDLVYSSNALDHTRSPRRCLEQMCRVLRPGGFLLLEGFVREGRPDTGTGCTSMTWFRSRVACSTLIGPVGAPTSLLDSRWSASQNTCRPSASAALRPSAMRSRPTFPLVRRAGNSAPGIRCSSGASRRRGEVSDPQATR
jgi:SAM-dependent methyltransferase